MAASARQRKAKPSSDGVLPLAAAKVGGFVSRNPAAVGGSTALSVALLYVSANALWYQPHAHTDPLFATRAFETFISEERRAELAQPQTTINIERPEQPAPRLSDPVVERVQQILSDLNFYAGDADGIKGPNTRQAIEAYQRKMGLQPTGDIDQDLLEQLGAADTTGAIVPSPRPDGAEPQPAETKTATAKVEIVSKIQTGLRAFGKEDIAVDGLLGARTKAGIKEFQSIFGLPATGEPDETVYAKMREAKLVD